MMHQHGGLFISDAHMSSDQAFLLYQCNQRILTRQRDFRRSRVVFMSACLVVGHILFWSLLKGSYGFLALAVFVIFAVVVLLRLLIPSRSGSRSGFTLSDLYAGISEKQHHRWLYGELVRTRNLLEDAGLQLEDWDWERRFKQVFEDFSFMGYSGFYQAQSDYQSLGQTQAFR